MKHFGDGRDWFFAKRYGLFIHWGIYAIPGWHEQHQFRLKVPKNDYVKLVTQFNPTNFNPEAWLDLAEEVGMRYLVFTTKHIDGFCMWNTAQTDYNVMQTPYGKDVLALLAEACQRRRFPLALYYSITDMHQTNYPTAGRRYEKAAPDPEDQPDLGKYIEFVKAQVRELCTHYGEIHGFWWDANELEYRDPSINAMIRKLQPNAVINNRGCDEGDYGTPERESEHALSLTEPFRQFQNPTEAVNSVSVCGWGYCKNADYYSIHHLVDSIDKTLAKGGNYLLNVGPDPLGVIPVEATALLRRVGSWYHRCKEAFDGTEPASDLLWSSGILLTRRGNSTLYVHLYGQPYSEGVILPPLQQMPIRAILLNNGNPVVVSNDLHPNFFSRSERFLQLRHLPVNEFSSEVLVIRLDFAEPVKRADGTPFKPFSE